MLSKKEIEEFRTPLYLYQESIFTHQFQQLQSALKNIPHLICFAVKANSNLSILKKFSLLGSGFDIVSGGELHRVIAAGAEMSKVVFAGVGKTNDEIRLGLASGIKFFNVESSEELFVIEAIAKEMSLTAPVSLRVNPNINVDTHPYLATGIDESKFGIPATEVISLYNHLKTSQYLSLIGIDAHIGSQVSDIAPYKETLKQLLSLANELRRLGAPIKTIDLGGGLGISFSNQYSPIDIKGYGLMIQELLNGTDYELVIEPGKFLIAESGSIISKVLYKKKNGGKEFLILDAGMNDLMRPSLYQAHHKIELLGKEHAPLTHTYDIGGPVCESGCIFSKNEKLPETNAGDFVIIKDAGAYGFSMSSNYNTRPRAAEVLIEADGTKRIIRRREETKELFAQEKEYL
jgi:diaminopimelate decarboxylase